MLGSDSSSLTVISLVLLWLVNSIISYDKITFDPHILKPHKEVNLGRNNFFILTRTCICYRSFRSSSTMVSGRFSLWVICTLMFRKTVYHMTFQFLSEGCRTNAYGNLCLLHVESWGAKINPKSKEIQRIVWEKIQNKQYKETN